MKKIIDEYKAYPFNMAISLAQLINERQENRNKILLHIDSKIPVRQHDLANLFSLTDKLSIKELSSITGRKRTSLVLILKRMEKSGLIKRIKIKGDRRAYYALCESIRNRLNMGLVDMKMRKVFGCFSEEERKEFIRLNTKLSKSFHAETEKFE